jgi:hypothetical protein
MLLRVAERLHVAPARRKRPLPEIPEAREVADARAQSIEAFAGSCGQHYDRPVSLDDARPVATEVDFVAHNSDRDTVRHGLLDKRGHRLRRILYPEDRVRLRHGLASAANTLFLDAIRVIAQAGRVHELDGKAVNIYALPEHIPGSAGDFGHDRRVFARQPVHEAGLTRVGFADDDDLVAVTHHAPYRGL